MDGVGMALANLSASQNSAGPAQLPLKADGLEFEYSADKSSGEDFSDVLKQQIADKPSNGGDKETPASNTDLAGEASEKSDSVKAANPKETAPEVAEPLLATTEAEADAEAKPDETATAGKGKVILDIPSFKKSVVAVSDESVDVKQPAVELTGANVKTADAAIAVADKAKGEGTGKTQQKVTESIKPAVVELTGKEGASSDSAIPAGKAAGAENIQQNDLDATKGAVGDLTGKEMASSEVVGTKAAAALEQVVVKMPTENADVTVISRRQIAMPEITARANANTSQDGTQNKSSQNAESQNAAGLKEAVKNKLSDVVGKSADDADPSRLEEQIKALASEVQTSVKSNNGLTAGSGVVEPVDSTSANAASSGLSTGAVSSAGRVDASGMTPPNPAQQIIESINATPLGSHRQINMALNPAGLGRVMIKFQQVGEEIVGTLQVEKLQTRNDIQEALPEIMASMNQHGVAVKEINVVMNQNHNQQQQTSQSHDEQVADFNNQKQLFGQQGQQGGQEKNEPSESMEERQEYSQPTKTVSQIGDEAINVYM